MARARRPPSRREVTQIRAQIKEIKSDYD
jgi:chaperonin GroEL (HSP60 family)